MKFLGIERFKSHASFTPSISAGERVVSEKTGQSVVVTGAVPPRMSEAQAIRASRFATLTTDLPPDDFQDPDHGF